MLYWSESRWDNATTIGFNYVFIVLNCSTGIVIFLYTVVLDGKMARASRNAIRKTSSRLTLRLSVSSNASSGISILSSVGSTTIKSTGTSTTSKKKK